MNKPEIIEVYDDNGEHSHWELIDSDTGVKLWSEDPVEKQCDHEWYGETYDNFGFCLTEHCSLCGGTRKYE